MKQHKISNQMLRHEFLRRTCLPPHLLDEMILNGEIVPLADHGFATFTEGHVRLIENNRPPAAGGPYTEGI